jgi:hypothetical protein
MMINLYKSREGDCYLAQFIGDQEIVDKFGTDTIPTGFTGQSQPEVNIATMQRLYPGHVVVLTDGRMELVATYGSSGHYE